MAAVIYMNVLNLKSLNYHNRVLASINAFVVETLILKYQWIIVLAEMGSRFIWCVHFNSMNKAVCFTTAARIHKLFLCSYNQMIMLSNNTFLNEQKKKFA